MSCLRWALAVLVCLLLLCTFIWELHIELQVYPRSWIASEIQPVKPLAGCFERSRISKEYNVTAAFAPKRFEIHSGTPMRLGMDCYDFASTIQARSPRPGLGHEAIGIPEWDAENWNYPGGGRIYFHTYWRVDLVPFEERQESLIKSFLATQNLNRTTMILWTNGDGKLRANPHVARWLKAFPEAFEVRLINLNALAKGTELEGSHLLNSQDARAWIDGDLLRLLVTWAFGGVWIDMDSLLIRDMSPLLEHEFVTQWDCYDKIYRPFNGAVMHFFKHSPYLCEAFHIMHRGPAPRSGSTDWGSLLYHKVFRSLMAAGIPPFKILPYCLTDGRSCRLDNRLPDPFMPDPLTWANAGPTALLEGGKLDDTLRKVFSVHVHNQWEKKFPKNGWVERLLLRRYDLRLPDAVP